MFDQLFHIDKNSDGTPRKKESLAALWRLVKIMLINLEFEDMVSKVVNSMLVELGYLNLGYRIIVLSLADNQAGGLRRIALSQTEQAARAKAASTIPFEQIVIPYAAKDNLCIRVFNEKKPEVTTSWPDLLTPPLTAEAALANQTAAGIKTSMVYPVVSQGQSLGVLIFSMIKDYKDVNEEQKDLLSGFADLVGLALQNSLLYTSLRTTKDSLQQTNQEVVTMNARLQELDKLKDDFVSIASHELRTPMTAIRSYVWMALHHGDAQMSEKMKKYLTRTLISTERLINLVNDMLNISRIESGRVEIIPEALDIMTLIDDTIAEVEPKIKEKNITMTIHAEHLPQVFADPGKVHQVLLNLYSNALKFTPVGGTITTSFFTDGQVLEIHVKDSGVGIAKEDLPRLFQKFGRLDSSYVAAATSGGTGLGLYICKILVELMRGRIWATSEGSGKGASFNFSLPIATPKVVADAEKYTKRVDGGESKLLEPVAV